tara:strand:- start:546 stop:1493 length:948 start_codon:yes stop_codon:yes gene_type:complete
MSIDKADLVTAFGDYYINEGQNMNRLLSQLRQKSETPTYAKPLIHDGEIYRYSNVVMGEIVQQFQKKFVHKGDVEFKPNEIRLRHLMIDIELYPDEVESSWLGFLGSIDGGERKDYPIVKYLLENEIIPQMKHDIEMKGYFKGEYETPVADTAGETIKAIDGLKSILDAGIADSSMDEITLSATPTAANAFDIIEEFVDGLDDIVSGVKKRIYMDPAILRWYHRDKRNTHGTDVNYNAEKPVVDFTNVELVGLPSMSGEKYIFSTPNDNFLYIRRVNGMKAPRLEESKKAVYLMTDWWEGIGFGYNPLVSVATWV